MFWLDTFTGDLKLYNRWRLLKIRCPLLSFHLEVTFYKVGNCRYTEMCYINGFETNELR